KREPIHLGHVDVGQNDVDVFFARQRFERFDPAVGKEEMEFTITNGATKLLTDQLFQVHFVVHHENSGRHSPLARLRRGKNAKTPASLQPMLVPLERRTMVPQLIMRTPLALDWPESIRFRYVLPAGGGQSWWVARNQPPRTSRMM